MTGRVIVAYLAMKTLDATSLGASAGALAFTDVEPARELRPWPKPAIGVRPRTALTLPVPWARTTTAAGPTHDHPAWVKIGYFDLIVNGPTIGFVAKSDLSAPAVDRLMREAR